ncbi:hypothetical protein C6P46_006477 [Rhodotorula mucilaginosa]|uniref:Nudix hydrolase domain-containing protein n=1 Tax=Rhodotorula mucilaginosa TaxID=5537 RepID=A0A9P6VYG9_RHOMI|nr:hypothetical protein C6P46_006477 [Rhodotorula mucilaginosa]
MPIPRSRPFVPRSPSTPRVPALQTSAEELGTYSEGELLDDPEAFETALSSIEPLSDKSLKAIANLARYKPPPDPYPFPEGRSAVLVVLFGSRSGENLNVLLSTRIALPGGKMDDEDINLEATARREGQSYSVQRRCDTRKAEVLMSSCNSLRRSRPADRHDPDTVLDDPASLLGTVDDARHAGGLLQSGLLNTVAELFSFPLEAFLTADPHAPIFHHPPPARVEQGLVPYLTIEDYPWFDGTKHRYHAFEADPQPIVGLTAEILIHVAMIAYRRQPDFKLKAPGQMSQRQLILRAMQDPKWIEFRRNWRRKKTAEADKEEKLKGKL